MNHEIRNTPEFTPDFSLLAFLSGEIQSTKNYVRNYQEITRNKPNFSDTQMNVKFCYKMNYENFIPLARQKTNPIQTQYKPNQTQSNPIKANFNAYQTQFKPKQTQYKPCPACFLPNLS